MEAELSPSQEFQRRRRLSVDAEDELFKSLQGVQELNNSQRQQRTGIGSPGNFSQRTKRRNSLDLNAGLRTSLTRNRNHSSRKERRTFSLDLNGGQKAAPQRTHGNSNEPSRNSADLNGGQRKASESPANRVQRVRRRSSVEGNRVGSSSSRLERRSIDASVLDSSSRSTSNRARPRRRTSVNNNGVSPKRNSGGQKALQSLAFTGDVATKPQPRRRLNRHASGGAGRKAYRPGRRASTGMADSPEFTAKSIMNSAPTNIRNVSTTETQSNNGVGMKPQTLRLEETQSSSVSERKSFRLGRRASTGMGPEINPVIVPKRATPRRSSPEIPANPLAPSGSALVIRSFNRRLSLSNASPTSSPTSPSEAKGPIEATMNTDILKKPFPPKFNNSTRSSFASFSFDGDDDILDSDLDMSFKKLDMSERTDSTKRLSEHTAFSILSENSSGGLHGLLGQLKDPVDVERRRMERERPAKQTSSTSSNSQTPAHHDKVAEQSSSRTFKTFLQRSKRGYGQQANMDGLSVTP